MSSDSYRLDSLLEVTSSKRIHMADYVPSGVPFYRGKEVIERAKGNPVSTELFITQAQYQEIKRKFGSPQDGDILLTSVGTLGVAYFVEGDGDFYFKDGNVTWFRNFDPRVVPKYLYYWLTSPETQKRLDEVSIGSTQRALTISALKSLQVQLPSVDSQKAIVDMLDAVTNRITLLRETNATLEAIAQALFKSWFVDFDPVRAKLEGRTPEGMDEATAALFPDGFETSELGEVPRGWRVAKVGEVAEVVKGKSYSSKDLVDSHHTALVTLKSFERGGGFRMDGFKPYSGAYKPSQVVSAGDLIVAYTDVTQAAELIGKPAVVVGVDEYATLVASLDVGIVRPDERHCGKQFLYGLFRTDAFQSHTLAHTSGTTVLHLAKDGIGSFAFALPPNELIRSFEVTAAAIWS